MFIGFVLLVANYVILVEIANISNSIEKEEK